MNHNLRSAQPDRRAARIGAPGSALVLPAASPYEWQVLCEHVVAAARQRGTVRLRVDGVDCVVRSEQAGVQRCCSSCGRALLRVSLRMAWRDLCLGCAQGCLAGAAAEGDALTAPAGMAARTSVPSTSPHGRR
jgi:hypothetical protein